MATCTKHRERERERERARERERDEGKRESASVHWKVNNYKGSTVFTR